MCNLSATGNLRVTIVLSHHQLSMNYVKKTGILSSSRSKLFFGWATSSLSSPTAPSVFPLAAQLAHRGPLYQGFHKVPSSALSFLTLVFPLLLPPYLILFPSLSTSQYMPTMWRFGPRDLPAAPRQSVTLFKPHLNPFPLLSLLWASPFPPLKLPPSSFIPEQVPATLLPP